MEFKYELKFTNFILFTLMSVSAFGQGLKQSHHDFSGAAWSDGEMCKPCHTPHDAEMEVPQSPLWNHQVTGATFDVYTSVTLDSDPGQPAGHSKLCLSCHDGTVAIDSHSGSTSGTIYAGFGNLSSDIRDDHPISFLYDASLASLDGQLHDPSTSMSGLGSTIEIDLLSNGNMECTSCHDVHISRNIQGCTGCHVLHGGGGMTTTSLSLRKSNEFSALCLTCHDK